MEDKDLEMDMQLRNRAGRIYQVIFLDPIYVEMRLLDPKTLQFSPRISGVQTFLKGRRSIFNEMSRYTDLQLYQAKDTDEYQYG